MLIGKPGDGRTAIARADAAGVEVRGRDLVSDLMGRLTFTEYFFLLVTGKTPTEEQTYFLDLLLVAIAEHGLVPSAVAARVTYAASPDSLQGAVAAGILGAGSVVLGTAERCAAVLTEAGRRIAAGSTIEATAAEIAREIQARGEKMPGFGHPLHKPLDPRAERILRLAAERSVASRHVTIALAFTPAVAKTWGRSLPMNVSMPIAAVLLDLDFPPAMTKAIPILARTGGLLAHLAEEQARPIGFLMAAKAEEAIGYDGGSAGSE